jgi:ketosteroid isomerase-like protein
MMLARRLRQGYAAANRRDFDFLLTSLDPDIEYYPVKIFPDPDPIYYGHHGYRKLWRDVTEAFEDFRLDPEELLDFTDRWLVTVNMSGHGAGSGVAVSQHVFQLFTLRRGLVVRQDDFLDRAKALEAMGLRE